LVSGFSMVAYASRGRDRMKTDGGRCASTSCCTAAASAASASDHCCEWRAALWWAEGDEGDEAEVGEAGCRVCSMPCCLTPPLAAAAGLGAW
jgi:hypothetical protein